MDIICTKLALYWSKNECARTENVFFPISEVCNGTVSLVLSYVERAGFQIVLSPWKQLVSQLHCLLRKKAGFLIVLCSVETAGLPIVLSTLKTPVFSIVLSSVEITGFQTIDLVI